MPGPKGGPATGGELALCSSQSPTQRGPRHIHTLATALIEQSVVHHGGLRRPDVTLQDLRPVGSPVIVRVRP